MKRLGHSIRALTIASAVVLGASSARAEKPTTKPASATSAKPVPKRTGTPAALTKAITDLSKEFTDYAAKPDSTSIRVTADFFKTLPEDVTTDDVLAVIEKGMNGSAPQVAYVKWQLLSACTSKVDGAQAGKVYTAYRNAPQPLLRFSGDPRTHSQLDKMIVGMKDGQEDNLNDQMDKQRSPIDGMNKFILSYRDALFKLLPTNADVLIARLQDGAVRIQAGIESNPLLNDFGIDVHSWLTSDATPQQASAVLAALKEAQKMKGPEIYKKATWNGDLKAVKWEKAVVVLEGKACTAIEKDIKEYLANPGGSGLKFK